MSDDELELLAPWNEIVKAEIGRRANESNQSYVNCQGANYAQTECQFRYCGTAIPFLTVRSTAR